jgi:hypothetical protein
MSLDQDKGQGQGQGSGSDRLGWVGLPLLVARC